MPGLLILFYLLAVSCARTLDSLPKGIILRNPLIPPGRIVNGTKTDIKDVPYLATLEYEGEPFCGGALISNRHVLTASNCFLTVSEDAVTVRVGAAESLKGGYTHKVRAFWGHPKFDLNTLDYDVGVIELNEEVIIGSALKPIKLIANEPENSDTMTVSGFEYTKVNHEESNSLLTVDVPVLDKEKCKDMYSDFKMLVSDRMICAFAESEHSCQGESGAPGVVQGKLAGIVSWGGGCVDPGYPGVYTNVADPEIRAFIREITS